MLPLRYEVGGWNLEVFARAIVIPHSGVFARETQMVRLEASFSDFLTFWAKAVGVPATMLGRHGPTNFCGATCLPKGGCLLWKHFRAFIVCMIAFWNIGIGPGIVVATRDSTWVSDWSLAWRTPRVVLGEIAIAGLPKWIP
jgi:hypothetical protein